MLWFLGYQAQLESQIKRKMNYTCSLDDGSPIVFGETAGEGCCQDVRLPLFHLSLFHTILFCCLVRELGVRCRGVVDFVGAD